MILIDTSILIDSFKGKRNKGVEKFRDILHKRIPFGITNHIYQEVLQGSKNENEFSILKEYLDTQKFFDVINNRQSYESAAKIYFDLRKNGYTVRSTIDCLIAQITIENNLYLLHNDKDYEKISKICELKIYD